MARPGRSVQSLLRRRATRLPIGVSVAARLVLGVAAMVALGTALLSFPGMTTAPLTLMDTLFTAASAVTVTGLIVVPTSTAFTPLGQLVILLLIQFGGLGYVVLVVAALRLLGRHVPLTERMALANELGVGRTRSILSVLQRTIILMLVIEAVGAAALFLYWGAIGAAPEGRTLFYAVFHAVAAFCNAGFDLFYGLPGGPTGPPVDIPTMLIIGVIVILGGLGIPVYLDLLYGRRRRRLSLHSRVTVIAAISLILIGMGALLLSEYWLGGALSGESWAYRTTLAWFQSVVTRTAGFPGLAGFVQLQPASVLVLIGLMFIGSGPASMGGGITTGTLAVLVMGVASTITGRRRIHLGHRSIPRTTILRAATVLTVALLAVALATWLLLLSGPYSFEAALFEVVSAFSTVGLSLGITPELTTIGRLIIITMMVWGRLGAMTIVVALAQHRARVGLVEYPEGEVLVG
jgi:trk system potassium uptake protein TrkH